MYSLSTNRSAKCQVEMDSTFYSPNTPLLDDAKHITNFLIQKKWKAALLESFKMIYSLIINGCIDR